MLNRLDISNYALIDNASIQFESGFSTITGETGAGKSILLKALNLLLGERADTSVLKQSEKKCFLEAEFEIEGLQLELFFEQNELEYETPCIVRREFSNSGKSRCFINDSPVQITLLKELGQKLVNIHSQHQTLHLFEAEFQMDVVDSFSGITETVKQYQTEYKKYREKVKLHIQLQVKEMENRKEKDYLQFLINELNLADLDNTDLSALKLKNDKVEFAEKITEGLGLANSVFENDTFGPQIGIKTLIETFEDLKKYDPKYADIAGRLISLKIELDDLASEIASQSEEINFSESDTTTVKEKMDLLNSLCFKHNLSEISELVALKNKFEQQLNEIDGVENELKELSAEIEQYKASLGKKANTISDKRKSNTQKLSSAVKTTLNNLSMEDAEMKIELIKEDRLGPSGFDSIQFMFKTNLGGQFLPLKKTASGGELSRLMLAIMSLLSECKQLPTLIFDEIDTGVSGEVASKIASEFSKMGNKIQLIAITHLPQVAARGAHHLHVSKSNSEDKTTTSIVILTKEQRINELAKMISGEQLTDVAKENAVHLLNIS